MDESSSEQFSNKLSYVNYVLSIFIVITHTYCVDYADIGAVNSFQNKVIRCFLEIFQSHVCQTVVPTFFAISGYLFFRNFTINDLSRKWKSRIKTLLIPYLLWNLIAFVFYYVISNIPITRGFLSMNPISLTVQSVLEGVLLHSFTVLWFVKVLMIFVIAAPAFYLLLKSKTVAVVVLFLFIAVGIFYPHKSINTALYTLAFYFLGAYMGTYHKTLVENKREKWQIVLISVLAVVTLFLSNCCGSLSNYIFKIVWIVGIWCIFDMVDVYKKPPQYIKISFFMYCIHQFFIRIIEKVIWNIIPNGGIINIFLTVFMTIFVITLTAYGLKKFMPKLWKVLNGGRG